MSETGVHLVYSTTASEEEAADIARVVVEERLAACANIIPTIRSIYRWQNKVEDDHETLLFLKTQSDCVPALISRIQTLHTYELPDIIALPLERGYQPYLDWVIDNTGSP